MKKENPGKKKYRRADARRWAEKAERSKSVAADSGLGTADRSPADEPLPVLEPTSPPPEWLGPGLLIPLYTLIIVIGYLLFARGLCTRPENPYKIEQSLFTSVNAASLTGFQQSRNPVEYTPLGQWVVLILMLTGIQFSFLASGLAVVRIVRMKFSDYQVLLWSVGVTAIASLVGAVGLLGKERSFFDCVFLAVSAFGNCGLTTGPLTGVADIRTHLFLIPLAVLGGLGLPVVMELGSWALSLLPIQGPVVDGRPDVESSSRMLSYYSLLIPQTSRDAGERYAVSSYSRLVIRWTAGAYVACFLVLLPLRWCGTHPVAWQEAVVGSSIQAVNARSAGFMIEPVNDFPQVLTAVLVVVMLIGAAPAGTGGGMKLTSIAVAGRGIVDAMAGRNVRRVAGLAAVWISIYLGLVGLITMVLLIIEPEFQLDRTLFMAASAVGNVGMTHNPIEASPAGLYTLAFGMIAGRIAPVLVLWWSVEKIPEAGIAVA